MQKVSTLLEILVVDDAATAAAVRFVFVSTLLEILEFCRIMERHIVAFGFQPFLRFYRPLSLKINLIFRRCFNPS